jgi:hypothetical protein
VDEFQKLALGHHDQQIFELLRYGCPLDIDKEIKITNQVVNHTSAIKYPNDIDKYIRDEISAGALVSIENNELECVHFSPLMSRPKEGATRRVIIDLSWPREALASVNSCVQENVYLKVPFQLQLPTVDNICKLINAYDEPVSLFKIDLARAFRQVPIDPLDVAYLGIEWQNNKFVDTALPFGYRHGSALCQRITDAVRYILNKLGVQVINYIDDFIGVVPTRDATRLFNITHEVLLKIGLVISESKTVVPAKQCTCLGININTEQFTLSIPKNKLAAIINICTQFLKFNKLLKKQIQSILGSLVFIHKAIKPARLFVNRIIALLRIAPHSGFIHIGHDFKRDLIWFIQFAKHYNGITQFKVQYHQPDFEIYTDASFSGLGAAMGNLVYEFPINEDKTNIAYWEALNILLALRTWADYVKHKKVKIYCDNAASVAIFQTSRGSDKVLQAIARNIWLLSAAADITLEFEHIPGRENCTADILSRWHTITNPMAKLFAALNNIPVWVPVNRAHLMLDWNI